MGNQSRPHTSLPTLENRKWGYAPAPCAVYVWHVCAPLRALQGAARTPCAYRRPPVWPLHVSHGQQPADAGYHLLSLFASYDVSSEGCIRLGLCRPFVWMLAFECLEPFVVKCAIRTRFAKVPFATAGATVVHVLLRLQTTCQSAEVSLCLVYPILCSCLAAPIVHSSGRLLSPFPWFSVDASVTWILGIQGCHGFDAPMSSLVDTVE